MTFDATKPVQTRDGRKARIICTDLKEYAHGDTIMALIEQDDGSETWVTNTSSGLYVKGSENKIDLINIPEKRWVNIYSDGGAGMTHPSRQHADDYADTEEYIDKCERIACIEFTEGDGL